MPTSWQEAERATLNALRGLNRIENINSEGGGSEEAAGHKDGDASVHINDASATDGHHDFWAALW